MMKRCPKCGITKEASEFHHRSGARARQLRGHCKKCEYEKYHEWRRERGAAYAEWQRKWREENPELSRVYSRRKKLKQQYGLTIEEADVILARGCAICGSHERLGIDHCHTSGKVRDALCRRCNIALGHLDDDPARLRAAADYLEKHRAEVVA